jgi:RNA polymerase sigma-70 factor, ECF subfamily
VEASTLAVAADNLIDKEYSELLADLTRLARAVGCGHDSEDVAQEALIHARGKLHQLRDTSRVKPWLRRSVIRRANARRRRLHETRTVTVQVLVPADPALGIDLKSAVAGLPERERIALTLVYGLGYTQEEAAAAMGIRRGTVASSLHRARRKLVSSLAEYRRHDQGAI